jgi:hypothetical protein
VNRLAITLAIAAAASPALAAPVATYVLRPPVPENAAVTSNVIFLDRCASGCNITLSGSDDSLSDHSTIGGGTLQAFACSDQVWNDVVQCMQDVFREFNVQIVTTDPGTASHLEVKVAGVPGNLRDFQGIPLTGLGGVAPFRCQQYQQNALVFDFANVFSCSVDDICRVAAQEIAHTWSLDHSTLAADPMSYSAFSGRRYYQNQAQQCGSDCTSGQSPLGQTCTGSPAQNHTCFCTGANTQNSWQEIHALFGAQTPTAPTTKITMPLDGAAVQPGFPVVSTVTSPYGAPPKAELRVDGQLVDTATSQPFVFNAPSSLGEGSHTVEVTGYDPHNVSSTTHINVFIGKPCGKPADCPNNTDTCIGGRCVPGPGVQGGLGMACTNPTQCASGQCDSDGTNMYCVETCMKGQCPSGFGCAIDMGDTGVCWPGYNDGSGGGGCAAGGGPLALGASALAMMLATRRRRR